MSKCVVCGRETGSPISMCRSCIETQEAAELQERLTGAPVLESAAAAGTPAPAQDFAAERMNRIIHRSGGHTLISVLRGMGCATLGVGMLSVFGIIIWSVDHGGIPVIPVLVAAFATAIFTLLLFTAAKGLTAVLDMEDHLRAIRRMTQEQLAREALKSADD